MGKVRTINKIRRYKLSDRDEHKLFLNHWINGCGGNGGFNFSKMLDRLKNAIGFKKSKYSTLRDDIEVLCFEHDIDFSMGGGFIQFLRANYIFCVGIVSLMQWTTSKSRLIMFLALFSALNFFGLQYFNWGIKKDLSYLLNTKNV